MSQNHNDFPNHGANFDSNAKAKRQELVNELRKSNLPPQHFNFPKSTAQESYASNSKSKEDEVQAIKQRKDEAEAIYSRVRGTKPNFTLGGHKLDYTSENKGRMQEPAF